MRIAQISDLHLRHHLPGTASLAVRLSRLMPERFAQALERIRALSPDILVISGDLLARAWSSSPKPGVRRSGAGGVGAGSEALQVGARNAEESDADASPVERLGRLLAHPGEHGEPQDPEQREEPQCSRLSEGREEHPRERDLRDLQPDVEGEKNRRCGGRIDVRWKDERGGHQPGDEEEFGEDA